MQPNCVEPNRFLLRKLGSNITATRAKLQLLSPVRLNQGPRPRQVLNNHEETVDLSDETRGGSTADCESESAKIGRRNQALLRHEYVVLAVQRVSELIDTAITL